MILVPVSPLPGKPMKNKEWRNRVLFFDPAQVFQIISIDPYSRRQQVSIKDVFPKNGKLCGCGCGRLLPPKKSRWATKECQLFAVDVWAIITGRTEIITRHIKKYHRWKCAQCGSRDRVHQLKSGKVISWLKIDHIVPVKHGGGACWLNNYQVLCHACHVKKTKTDFSQILKVQS